MADAWAFTDMLESVVSYSAHLASLTLEHNHPPGNELKAIVDIRLVLDKLLHEHTRIGEWLNIIGYVERPQSRNLAGVVGRTVNVQAIAVWSAGPLRLQAYEECLDNSQMNVSGSETATKQGVM